MDVNALDRVILDFAAGRTNRICDIAAALDVTITERLSLRDPLRRLIRTSPNSTPTRER